MSLYEDFVKSKAKQSVLFIDGSGTPDFDAYKPSTVTMPTPTTAVKPIATAPAGKTSLYDQFQAKKTGTASAPLVTTSAPAPAEPSFFQKATNLLTGYSNAVLRKAVPLVAGTIESAGSLVRSVEWLGNRLIGDSLMQAESAKNLAHDVAVDQEMSKRLVQAIRDGKNAGKDTSRLEQALASTTIDPNNYPQTLNTQGFGVKTGQLASKAASFLKEEAGITPENQTFVERAIEGLGSSLPYFVPGVGIAKAVNAVRAAPALAMMFGNASSAALESMAEAGQVYDEVVKTKGEQAAMEASMRTFLANAVVLTVTQRIGIFNPSTGSLLKKTLLSSPIEGIQEGLQQMISNKETGRPLWDGVLESTAIGGIVGGVLGPTVDIVALNQDIVDNEVKLSTNQTGARSVLAQQKPETPQDAAKLYWDNVIQKDIESGKGITLGADNMKDFFGKDYGDSRHSVYSKASYSLLFPKALQVDTNPDVVLVGGGPASAKTEGLINRLRESGFKGIIYDSNASVKEGIFAQIDAIRAAGKNPVLVGIIPNVERSAKFAFTRERQVSEESFVRGHAGFPAVAEAAITEGKLSPDEVRLVDSRDIAKLTDVKAAEFAADPLALLKEARYSEEYARGAYQAAKQAREIRLQQSDGDSRSDTQGVQRRGSTGEGYDQALEELGQLGDFGGPIIGEDRVAKATQRLDEIRLQRETLEDTIKNSPAARFEKYIGPSHRLGDGSVDFAEIQAMSFRTGSKAQQIDQYLEEAGFRDFDELNTAYQDLLAMRNQLKEMRTSESAARKQLADERATQRALGTRAPREGTIRNVPKDTAQSRVFERLQAEYPEELRGKLTYETINLKDQAKKALYLVEENREKAFRIAMGAEESTEVTSTAVNIALSELALETDNLSLYTRLIKNRSLAQTRRGQEIVSEKGSVSDNDTSHFVKQLISSRLEALGRKYLSGLRLSKMTNKEAAIERIDKEVTKAKEKMTAKELDLSAAQKLIDSLAC